MTEMNTTEHVISNDPGFEKMTLPEMIFGVGFGSFGIILFMQVVAQFNTFLTEYMGMRPYIGILGTIVLAAKTIEILTGLIMGYLIDKKSTRHGRTRHFLLIDPGPYLTCYKIVAPENSYLVPEIYFYTGYFNAIFHLERRSDLRGKPVAGHVLPGQVQTVDARQRRRDARRSVLAQTGRQRRRRVPAVVGGGVEKRRVRPQVRLQFAACRFELRRHGLCDIEHLVGQ